MNPLSTLTETLRGLQDRVGEARDLPRSDKRMLVLFAVVAALVVGTLVAFHGIARRESEVTPSYSPSYSRLERSLLSTLVRETAD